MLNELKFEQKASAAVVPGDFPTIDDLCIDARHRCTFKGVMFVKHYDKDGNLKGTYKARNGVTNEGKDAVLDIMFHGSTQITTWYLGIMDNSGYTAEAAGDTLASHAGWSEFTTYTGNRKEWTEGAASSQSITNSATVDFAITGSATLKGVFLCSAATGTTGTLWATAAFSSTVAVTSGDTLKVTYTVSA